MEHSHWERSHWVFLLWSCSPVNVLCYVPFHPLCGLTKYTVVGTALGPALSVGMQAIGLVDSPALFSPSHCCRCTELMSQDCSSCAVFVHLWKLWRQFELCSCPTPTCTCPQSPQLLKPDCTSCKSTFCPFGCFTGTEFRKLSAEV